MKKLAILALATTAALASTAASAATIYDLPANGVDGNCVFNTTCGPQAGVGNVFAAQRFTLAAGSPVKSGTFTVYNNSKTQPTALNYLFLAADGTGGLPGTVLFSGTTSVVSRDVVGSGFGFDLVRTGVNFSGVTLGAGTYYFGLQAVSSEFGVYLAYANGTGAAQSIDNGATWAAGYQDATAVATSLDTASIRTAVPEPATWAMMLLGFGMVGGAARYRRRAVRVAFA